MKIFLVRHGHAVPASFDPARPLSENGEQEVRAAAKKLMTNFGQQNIAKESWRIWHSKKLRAKQTAAIIGEVIGLNTVEKDGLLPEDDVQWLGELLMKNGQQSCEDIIVTENDNLIIVGHMPFLGVLASQLISRGAMMIYGGQRLSFNFRTAEIFGFELG